MSVVTRFAPSPTGFLHIGGARTALFNWLFARHHGGTFLLRIEDTDRQRSTQEAVDAIYDGLRWLGLDWDGDAISQFARADRHREAVERLLAEGRAYKCYCTPEELATMREQARAEGRRKMYDGRWRDCNPAEAPTGVAPAIRLRAPDDGETVIRDAVQGEVRVANAELDDMILLRGDGTPTYMLAVVVDDHDMGVTHVIRGDDHLTNAFRQTQLFQALGWETPLFAHIPLIHGADGAKMSKRHGALGVDAYRDQGFLPEAVCNYLLRLGWSHGDDEIISRDQAVDWFTLDNAGKSAARFDVDKLTALNGHYIRTADDAQLAELIAPMVAERLGKTPSAAAMARIQAGLPGLKERAKTLLELTDNSLFYAFDRPISLNDKARQLVDAESRQRLRSVRDGFADVSEWTEDTLETWVREFAERTGTEMGAVAQPLRAALTGTTVSPSIFEVLAVLGRDEALGRIGDAIDAA
ncbi:MAG: glutamate--tRNA ligase [Rhodospirillaceae bacterium]